MWMWTVVSCSELVLVIRSLYPSNWIFLCPDWLTPMRRLDLRARASLHSPPLKNRAKTSCGLAIRPLDKDYYHNQQIPPVILLGLSSSSKGIKDSNNVTARTVREGHEHHHHTAQSVVSL